MHPLASARKAAFEQIGGPRRDGSHTDDHQRGD
jgi:hypothetical protein